MLTNHPEARGPWYIETERERVFVVCFSTRRLAVRGGELLVRKVHLEPVELPLGHPPHPARRRSKKKDVNLNPKKAPHHPLHPHKKTLLRASRKRSRRGVSFRPAKSSRSSEHPELTAPAPAPGRGRGIGRSSSRALPP